MAGGGGGILEDERAKDCDHTSLSRETSAM